MYIVTKAIICAGDQTIGTVKKLTPHTDNLFELYGFDILIDENLNPCLLEINLNPSLNCDTELDLKVKSSLMTDIFNLVGVVPYAHNTDEINNNNNKKNKNQARATIYNNLNQTKDPNTMNGDLNALKKYLEKFEKNDNEENYRNINDVEMATENENKNKDASKNKNNSYENDKIVLQIIEEYDQFGLDMNIGNFYFYFFLEIFLIFF